MKAYRILLIISICLISVGGILIIAGIVFSLQGNSSVGDLLMGFASFLGLASLALMIVRLVIMARNPDQFRSEQPKVVVKVVDVKEVPKSKEQELYDQYEDLYNRNLITKEELDRKRKELLGK